MRGNLRQVPLRTDGSKLCCVWLCQPVTRGKLRIYSGCKQYLMALGGKFWHYLPHCTVLWSSDCPEASYPSRGSRVDCQRKKEQRKQRHLSCKLANKECTYLPITLSYTPTTLDALIHHFKDCVTSIRYNVVPRQRLSLLCFVNVGPLLTRVSKSC